MTYGFLQRKLHEYDELVSEIERLKQEAGGGVMPGASRRGLILRVKIRL